ncbi:class I SAM-dependent methyltransferase [Halopiger djelfimassiliensis]|uniref:class I SAM-dependent methyltransferase n=1 Tax=Halopiger djelfimassiliensis TaxID=1293047 RepID=UPI0006778DE9|nr:class I SAM-dependent methyltransferase [Halopiger djelfimassiliensis]
MSDDHPHGTSTGDGSEPTVSHPLFAAVYDRWLPEPPSMKPHRTYLARNLSGRVLELGIGNGAMVPFVAANADDGLEYHAIEPDPHMRKRAHRAARKNDVPVRLRDARAESLPYPDDAFDIVVSAVVFCTVQDPDAAIDEVARVLKPDGEFRFLEHVHADGWRGTGQDLLNPLWERAAGGCQLTRKTVERFVEHDAFAVEEIERVSFGIFPVTPVVRGTLRRRRAGLEGFIGTDVGIGV